MKTFKICFCGYNVLIGILLLLKRFPVKEFPRIPKSFPPDHLTWGIFFLLLGVIYFLIILKNKKRKKIDEEEES
jgi:pilus assembly protein TadC